MKKDEYLLVRKKYKKKLKRKLKVEEKRLKSAVKAIGKLVDDYTPGLPKWPGPGTEREALEKLKKEREEEIARIKAKIAENEEAIRIEKIIKKAKSKYNHKRIPSTNIGGHCCGPTCSGGKIDGNTKDEE